MKKVLSLMMALAMLISVVGGIDLSAYAQTGDSRVYVDTFVNPYYEDLFGNENDDNGVSAYSYSEDEADFYYEAPSVYATTYTEDRAIEILRDKMVARTGSVTLTVQTVRGVSSAAQYIMSEAISQERSISSVDGDYLMWNFHKAEAYSNILSTGATNKYRIQFNMEYLTTAAQEQQVTSKVKSVLKSLNLDGKSDYQKILLIHNFVCENARYDYEHVYDTSYKVQFTTYGALINGYTVCQGYATLFYRLCMESGISCRVIASEDHGWNIVKLGGKYYNVDTTWDDTQTDYYPDSTKGYWSDDYVLDWFLIGSDDFIGHYPLRDYTTNYFKNLYPISQTNYVCPHSVKKTVIPAGADCTKGYEQSVVCTECGKVLETTTVGPATEHTYKTTLTKATKKADGKITVSCVRCGKIKSAQTIAKISSSSLSPTATYYNGTVKTPRVTVKDSKGKTLTEGADKDYTVSFDSGRVNVGRYAVKITYRGNYSGSETLYFNVIPRGTEISSVACRATGFTVNWKTQKTQTTGYQVQYSKNSNFSNATTITMPKTVYYAKAVSGLAKNTKYYVRVRTYKTTKFNGQNYNIYSPWCASKTAYTVTTTAKLSTTATYYNGKVKTPGVTVKDSAGRTLKRNTDYTVSFASGRKYVGRYAVTIKYKGSYTGVPSQTLYFNIIPKGVSKISKITARSKGFTVQWTRQTTQTTGYQIQYSTSSNFKNAKTITMPKSSYYAKKVTDLSANKKYYVRIRTYKTTKFNGKNYNVYSFWCAAKTVTTKR